MAVWVAWALDFRSAWVLRLSWLRKILEFRGSGLESCTQRAHFCFFFFAPTRQSKVWIPSIVSLCVDQHVEFMRAAFSHQAAPILG